MPVGVGYSPDFLADEEKRAGSLENLMRNILSARYGEQGADPRLRAMSSSDRAAIDRYANLALAAKDQGPMGYPGSVGLMALTEMLKAAQPLQSVASSAWNAVRGTPGAPGFFGGQDVSPPSLANVMAAHYGYMRGLKR